jgi:dipeptidase
MYLPKDGETAFVPWAHIPEVPKTFGYYESISPLMNDQGLGIGESSCSAMLQNKAPDSTEERVTPIGILDAMSLMQLALERCATSRCAVEVMGQLSEEYGYLPFTGEPTASTFNGRPMWSDSGEAYTLADASGEAWVFNVLGGVEGITKSVWAARRVPRGHVAVVANEFTLGELPSEPNEDYLFSNTIFDAARTLGWDGQAPLNFMRVFAPDPTLYTTGTPPTPLYNSLRRWRLHSLVAPSANIEFKFDQRDYPFSVAVENPLSHRDVMTMMADHYAGTEFDMSLGVLAGPYRTPFRVEGGPTSVGQVPRGISILRTLYSTITQTGPEGSVLWYAADTPATSVYIPLDSRSSGVAPTYKTGKTREFDRSAAWWAFDFVNNWMQLNYHGMSTEDVLPRKENWQDRLDSERALKLSVSTAELDAWQIRIQEELVADWWRLADFLIMKWNDMSRTTENVTDKAVGYPEWWVKMIGYSNDVHPVWVQPAAEPEPSCPDYVPATIPLPRQWNDETHTWQSWGPLHTLHLSLAQRDQGLSLQMSTVGGLVVLSGFIGFAMGRRCLPGDSKPNPLLG